MSIVSRKKENKRRGKFQRGISLAPLIATKLTAISIMGKALDNNDLNQVESAMFALSCGIPNGNVPKAKYLRIAYFL